MKKPLTSDEFLNFLSTADKVAINLDATRKQLIAAAQIHTTLIEHHALRIQNLMDKLADSKDTP
jgi:hypothetical protein